MNNQRLVKKNGPLSVRKTFSAIRNVLPSGVENITGRPGPML